MKTYIHVIHLTYLVKHNSGSLQISQVSNLDLTKHNQIPCLNGKWVKPGLVNVFFNYSCSDILNTLNFKRTSFKDIIKQYKFVYVYQYLIQLAVLTKYIYSYIIQQQIAMSKHLG